MGFGKTFSHKIQNSNQHFVWISQQSTEILVLDTGTIIATMVGAVQIAEKNHAIEIFFQKLICILLKGLQLNLLNKNKKELSDLKVLSEVATYENLQIACILGSKLTFCGAN